MRAHTEKLANYRKNEDPRMSFTTPEFKEASRQFSEAFKVRLRLRGGVGAGRTEWGRGGRQAGTPRVTERRAEAPAPLPQKNFGKPVEWGMVKRYPVRERARRGVVGGYRQQRRRHEPGTLTRAPPSGKRPC